MAKKAEAKKPEPKQTTSVAKQPSGPLVLIQTEVPEHLREAMSQSRGSENVGTEDLVIPRLEVLQGLSAALKPGDPAYINGAQQGVLINSVSRKVYGKEVMFVPVVYMKQFLVWRDIKKGGGFYGAFPDMEAAKARADEEGGVSESTGIEIIDTPVHLGLIIDRDTGKVEEIMVSMPRTKAKISRQWNSMIRMAGGDRFMRVYKIGTSLEKKNNQEYWNFTVAQSGFPSKAVYEMAKATYESIQSGKSRVMDVKDFQENNAGDGDTEM